MSGYNLWRLWDAKANFLTSIVSKEITIGFVYFELF